MKFKITVKQIVKKALLDTEDKDSNPKGIYHIEASNEEEALDIFHDNTPIACLDDFSIKIKLIREKSNAEKFIFQKQKDNK